jgi:hypothetical protein
MHLPGVKNTPYKQAWLFAPGERAIGWMGPRTGLDNVEKRQVLLLQELELQPGPSLSTDIPAHLYSQAYA